MYVAATLIIALAILHSVLGERDLLGPLFRAQWEVEEIPRYAMVRILRFGWHLTSIAWVALGLAALGWGALEALAVCAVLSSGLIFVMLRGHFAWAMFAVIGLSAGAGAGHLPGALITGIIGGAAALSAVLAAVHVYWAFGGRRGIAAAIPNQIDGTPMFIPPWWVTLLVAGALLTFAGLLAASLSTSPSWVEYLLIAACVVLGVRAIGDGKQVGFMKTDRSTRFAQLDDALYTPIATWMALAAGSATALL